MDDYRASELEALERILYDANAEPTQLSYALLRFITDNFSNEIGHGGFGVVYLGSLRTGMVAVKKLFKTPDFDDELFTHEITCLMRAKHKNIIRFLGYCSDTQGGLMEFNGKYVMAGDLNRLLCFEYVPNGNIQHFLKEKPCETSWHKRYNMIKGICHGLQYLHQECISHLDLKPENVMLDTHMEPKITDFGLSRIFGEGQTRIFTTNNIRGTLGYIAPEMIDKGEISFKSDIYSLGIIIIKLLTGRDNIDFENWDESLDVECPQVKSCIEIARACIETDKHNRPPIDEIIHKLYELEGMIQGSGNHQGFSLHELEVSQPIAFPGTRLLDVYPLELKFKFQQNEDMTCTFSLINKGDEKVLFVTIPDSPHKYRDTHNLKGILRPRCTCAIPVVMRAQLEPVLDTDKLELVMVLPTSSARSASPDDDEFDDSNVPVELYQLMYDIYYGTYLTDDYLTDDKLKEAQELGGEVHRTTLMSVVVASDTTTMIDQLIDDTTCEKSDDDSVLISIELHPTEPWVLTTTNEGSVYIWNWQTKQKIYEYCALPESGCLSCVRLFVEGPAKFIARKQWLVVGDRSGFLFVHTLPLMDRVHEIKIQDDSGNHDYSHNDDWDILLAVHPTRSFLLSLIYSGFDGSGSMKLWDWNQDFLCAQSIKLYNRHIIVQAEFNPTGNDTFATIDSHGGVQIWKIGCRKPITKFQPAWIGETPTYYHMNLAYNDHRRLVTAILGRGSISPVLVWDFIIGKHAHVLYSWDEDDEVKAITCHPTRPVVVTASTRKKGRQNIIRVWDSALYRLKTTRNLRRCPAGIAFMDSRRLMMAYEHGVEILDIDLY